MSAKLGIYFIPGERAWREAGDEARERAREHVRSAVEREGLTLVSPVPSDLVIGDRQCGWQWTARERR